MISRLVLVVLGKPLPFLCTVSVTYLLHAFHPFVRLSTPRIVHSVGVSSMQEDMRSVATIQDARDGARLPKQRSVSVRLNTCN